MNGKVIAYKEIGLRVLGFKELGMHGLSDGAGGGVFGDYDKDGLIFQLDCGKNGDPYSYGGYIKDGLVLQLDCRQIDVGATEFYDITGNVYFSSARNMSKNLNGTVDMYMAESSSPLNILTNDNCTIEICGTNEFVRDFSLSAGVKDTNNKGILIDENLGSVYGIAAFVGNKIVRYNVPLSVEGVSTFSGYNYDGNNNCYIDNEAWQKYSEYDNDYKPRTGLYISSHDFYSIRIYNRVLTQKERDHNRQMDLKNFDKSVPTNAVLLNGGEPLKYANGDYVTYKN